MDRAVTSASDGHELAPIFDFSNNCNQVAVVFQFITGDRGESQRELTYRKELNGQLTN